MEEGQQKQTLEGFVLILKYYAFPRDAVRLSMTCKRLYRLLEPKIRLFMTCGIPYKDAYIWVNTTKKTSLCLQCNARHPDQKCPLGKYRRCLTCKQIGPTSLVRGLYGFNVKCKKEICQNRVTNQDRGNGCVKCGYLCKQHRQCLCVGCFQVVDMPHVCTVKCSICFSNIKCEYQCRESLKTYYFNKYTVDKVCSDYCLKKQMATRHK